MRKIIVYFLLTLTSFSVMSEEIPSIKGVYDVSWRVGFIAYRSLLVMEGGKNEMWVSFFDTYLNQTRKIKMNMRFISSSSGYILAGYDPINIDTNAMDTNYSPDNLMFNILPTGKFELFNVNDNGVNAKTTYKVITSKSELDETLGAMGVDSEISNVPSNLFKSEPKQTASVLSEEASESYVARLGIKDHFNSKGERLSSVAAIIRQDRANFHDLNVRDSEDESDSLFGNKTNREHLEGMLNRGFVESSAKEDILNGTPLILVKICNYSAPPLKKRKRSSKV
jgi:hypothetical protein